LLLCPQIFLLKNPSGHRQQPEGIVVGVRWSLVSFLQTGAVNEESLVSSPHQVFSISWLPGMQQKLLKHIFHYPPVHVFIYLFFIFLP
jgi:hypothetical protein